MIAREVIDEVLLRTDITSLIGSYVNLQRAGSTMKALCPFHSEKSPSFVVYPQDNSFYCFGCGMGGNAITFARQIEHLDFEDAVEFLGKRSGITVTRTRSDDRFDREDKKFDKNRILQMNVDAAKYFHACLFSDDPKAKEALAYFTEKRRLSIATINHFGLGYAPDQYDAFTEYMRKKGYTYDELVAGYLTFKKENGRYYDSFRNRVMFPIIDVSGSVIAFGGRVMDDSKPKYKNSSDTPVFKKSRNLFAMNFARLSCAEQIILCEGYMDVIAMHAAGFTNAVATLGTAITSEQARMMSRYTKKVIISYDADEPGQKAAQRATELLEEVGLPVSVLVIPGAKDPDEYIREFGKEKFSEVLNGSKDKFDYRVDNILKHHELAIPREKIKAVEEIVNVISAINSEAERSICIFNVAEKLSVERRAIENDVKRQREKMIRNQRKAEGEAARRSIAGYGDKTNPDFVKAPGVAKSEETVLGLLILYPEYRKKVHSEALLSTDDFFTDFGKRAFSAVMKAEEEQLPRIDFDENFTPEEVGRLTRCKVERMCLTDNGESVFLESIESLKRALRKKTVSDTATAEDLAKLIAGLRGEK